MHTIQSLSDSEIAVNFARTPFFERPGRVLEAFRGLRPSTGLDAGDLEPDARFRRDEDSHIRRPVLPRSQMRRLDKRPPILVINQINLALRNPNLVI